MTCPFKIEWIKRYPNLASCPGLHFSHTEKLINGLTDLSVNLNKNCQEISGEIGAALCSLLDDDLHKSNMQITKLRLIQEQKKEEREMSRIRIPGLGNWLEESKFLKTDAEVLESFLSKLPAVGEVILVSLYGSKRYNTQVATSDLDILAIVSYPFKHSCSLKPLEGTLKNPEGSEHDWTIHSTQYFCELLQEGDTKMLETLYQSEKSVVFSSPFWEKFQKEAKLGNKFLTKKAISKYVGEVKGLKGTKKITKLEKVLSEPGTTEEVRIRYWKTWYILFRCLFHAQSALERKELAVWIPEDSKEREFLLRVRAGNFTIEEINSRFQKELVYTENLLKTTDLPETAESQSEFLQSWIEESHDFLKEMKDHLQEPECPSEITKIISESGIDLTKKKLLFLSVHETDEKKEIFGVFTYFTSDLCSLRPPLDKMITYPKTTKQKGAKKEVKQADTIKIELCEASRFCEQILGGYPMMFLDTLCRETSEILYSHPLWNQIEAKKNQYFGWRLFKQCVGWLMNNIEAMKKGRSIVLRKTISRVLDLLVTSNQNVFGISEELINMVNTAKSSSDGAKLIKQLSCVQELCSNKLLECEGTHFAIHPAAQAGIEEWLLETRKLTM
eukprot:TRINITY_DN2974_c0_g2_i1.p1 TRINITY_DN2974_c0_g2~~TRINITY_DN2974_c0_g2_i1.p1  ORF type:complete len:616 (-),score=99.34 TRINITY_DN2974_c0_g2_i1:70-1917(-)